MSIRWTRTTATAAVAALTFIAVFAATLLLRPDPPSVAAVGAPQRPTTSTPATSPAVETQAGHEGHGSDDEPTTSTGSGSTTTWRHRPTAPKPTATAGPGTATATAAAGAGAGAGVGARSGSEDTAALAAATTFLSDVAGMTPVPGPVVRDGDTAEVTFYGRGEGGQVARGMVTVVSLRRHEGGWAATGARASTIEVDAPAPGAAVGSPLVVSGRAHAYEGTVHVRVVETLESGYGELGRGFVTGAGDTMGPFEGEIPFAPPSGAAGWVVFVEDSGADGATTRATVVPVELTHDPGCPDHGPPPPFLEAPTWDPEVVLEDGWLQLPAGAGTLTVSVRATDADEVDLVLTPTGTGTGPYAEVVDTSTGSDGVFTLEMEYADAPLLGHLSLVARGPGGETALDLAGVYHPDPQDPQAS